MTGTCDTCYERLVVGHFSEMPSGRTLCEPCRGKECREEAISPKPHTELVHILKRVAAVTEVHVSRRGSPPSPQDRLAKIQECIELVRTGNGDSLRTLEAGCDAILAVMECLQLRGFPPEIMVAGCLSALARIERRSGTVGQAGAVGMTSPKDAGERCRVEQCPGTLVWTRPGFDKGAMHVLMCKRCGRGADPFTFEPSSKDLTRCIRCRKEVKRTFYLHSNSGRNGKFCDGCWHDMVADCISDLEATVDDMPSGEGDD